MPQIKNVEIFWSRLDPERPHPRYKKKHVLEWSLAIRTDDPDVADRWKDEFFLKSQQKKDEETGKRYYQANLKKLAIDLEKHKLKELVLPENKDLMFNPVEVFDTRLNKLDARTIGNGSIGNIIVKLREWEYDGDKGTTPDLQRVQITRLVPYYFEVEEFDEIDEDLEIIEGNIGGEPKSSSESVDDDEEVY